MGTGNSTTWPGLRTCLTVLILRLLESWQEELGQVPPQQITPSSHFPARLLQAKLERQIETGLRAEGSAGTEGRAEAARLLTGEDTNKDRETEQANSWWSAWRTGGVGLPFPWSSNVPPKACLLLFRRARPD